MMGVLALSFSWMLGLVTVQQKLTTSMSAQTVADAVALAAVENGEPLAQEIVELNDASIISLTLTENSDQSVITAVVVVELDGVQAQAAASHVTCEFVSDTISVGECSTLTLWPKLTTHSLLFLLSSQTTNQ